MAEIRESRSVDRHEKVSVHQHDDHEHSVQVVEDKNASRRLVVSRIANVIWLLLVIVEALIGFRIVFKLLAADPSNPLANLVYTITEPLLWPFLGLTITPSLEGMVFEIPAIIAMFAYALVGWVVVRLVWLLFYWPVSRSVRIMDKEHDHLTDE